MTWGLQFQGNAIEIRQQFNTVIDQYRSNGMADGELADIEGAKEYVVNLANRYGLLKGGVTGSWSTRAGSTPNDKPMPIFGNTSLVFEGVTLEQLTRAVGPETPSAQLPESGLESKSESESEPKHEKKQTAKKK